MESKVSDNFINITQKAQEKVREIMNRKGVGEEYHLRIGVRGGAACMGMSYLLGFDKPKKDDIAFQSGKLNIVMEKKQVMFLAGLVIDWVEKDGEKGFGFTKGDNLGV